MENLIPVMCILKIYVFSDIMPEQNSKKLKTSSSPWEDNFRLPKSVHPDHYDLYMYPDLTSKIFSGTVTIHITSSEPCDNFLIHTKWLNITQTRVVRVDGNQVQVSSFINFVSR